MIYSFGEFVVNESRRQLLHGDTWLPTEPKVFDVLVFLIKNRERVVSREELLESCWPGIYVSDGTLSRCLSRIRHALGQSRSADKPIQTFHGRGYRFVADVQSEEATPADGAPPVDDAADAGEHDAPARGKPERRFVSVLECRLDRSETKADPEALQEALHAFADACTDILAGLPCSIAQQSARRVVIHVGYPRAAEKPAIVAVMAARNLIDLASSLDLKATVAIATGRAIVDPGTAGMPGQLLIGIDPVFAPDHDHDAADARVIVDTVTAGLLEERFPLVEAATFCVDGEPQRLFAVGRADSRGLQPGGWEEPPFVGRDWELIHLKNEWRRAANGTGRIVVLSGDPGIGKSRLCEELLSQIAIPEDRVLRVQCSPYHRRTPLYPLLDLLRRMLDVELETPPLKQLRAIEMFVDKIGYPETDQLSLLASLLSVSAPAHKRPALSLDPERQRERTQEALLFMIGSSAQAAPGVLLVDDLQWADSSTLATLEGLLPRVAEIPLMLVLSFRSNYAVTLPGLQEATRVTLEPLGRSQCMRLLTEQAHAGVFPAAMIDDIAERSDGVPLYLREITRMAASHPRGEHALADNRAIPDTLQGLLASRLDQIGEAREVAEWSGVIGRAFPRELLARVAGLADDELDNALAALGDAGILQERGRGETLEYSFSHVLVRDAVYEAMLLRTRRAYHRRVADVIVTAFPQIATAEPEQIARHYSASDEPALAAKYWQEAGHVLAEHDAAEEARTLYGEALDVARSGAATPDRTALIAEIEAMMADL